MVARGEMTQEEAEERFKEIGRRFQEKLTREATLDMMESGHLTMEESEVELRVRIKRKKNGRNTPRLSRPWARETCEESSRQHMEGMKEQLPNIIKIRGRSKSQEKAVH